MRPSPETVRAVVGRDRAACARCGVAIGTGQRGVDWSLHHRQPAGMGGTKRAAAHGPANLVVLCGHALVGCHGWVESHRLAAVADGWLVRRPTDPATIPVRHHLYGTCHLTADGGAVPVAGQVTA